ncbi:MAG TPA: efflux RND transporter periplasmic adaptor subunit, partial [Terriglobia bacterium]|nr:efflux RND transporter periplasmic adaptor subunit [Terriglobia bacterium]
MGRLRTFTLRVLGCLMVLAMVALLSTDCSDNKKAVSALKISPASMVVPVVVAKATQRDMPVQVTAIGTVEAYSTVTVKTLVDGEIQRAFFTEGQDVSKGERLFSID